MIDDVVDALACPHCAAGLSRYPTTVGCPNGHRFDIARQGYVSLLGPRSRTDTGDSAEMVAARADFLAAGHYTPIAAEVGRLLASASPGLIVEIGAGTGYYLAAGLDAVPAAAGIALDSSPRAARRAAGSHPAVGSVVADAWSTLPVRSGVADTVLSVFAPRNPAELRRVIADGGTLVVVTPAPDHLGELIGPLGMLSVGADKSQRLEVAMDGFFAPAGTRELRFPLALTHADVRNLVLMGPAARHVDRGALDRTIAGLKSEVAATVAVAVSCWQPLVR